MSIVAPTLELNATDTASDECVFEGPEKKLEVFFSRPADAAGFRRFGEATWSDLLVEVKASILHCKSNPHFDAYLLSESSLFVYPTRVILKTCGTTCLLLVLPKLLALAKNLGVFVEHAHYGHLRYKFPEQQLFPHSSFDEERAYLVQTFGGAVSRVLGPPDGRCWYALVTRSAPPVDAPPTPLLPPSDADDLFEVAMEGLAPEVCACFVGPSYAGLSGRALSRAMTERSGIGAVLPGVEIDDWAFEPCGYSMNGLSGAYYYTIHITPEEGFSYASFETNDPQYRQPQWVKAVAAVFQPSVCTVTLTTRRVQPELPSYALDGFARNSLEVASLGAGVSMCCINFSADADADACGSRKRKLSIKGDGAASPVSSLSASTLSFDSEGASASEAEAASDASSVSGEPLDGPEPVAVIAAC